MPTPELYYLPYSPWSKRIRWVLDVRRIPHERHAYQPLLGEPALRARLGQWTRKLSVPVLFTAGGALTDAWDMACWADERGEGPKLVPTPHLKAIREWHAIANAGLGAGRALSLGRVIGNEGALDELTPPPLRALGPAGRLTTKAGVAWTRIKYGGSKRSESEHRALAVEALDEIRRGLCGYEPKKDLRGRTLVGTFSFADISTAQVLAFVRPPEGSYLRLGAENRRCYGDPQLAEAYPDLLAWRDDLYARYRKSVPVETSPAHAPSSLN